MAFGVLLTTSDGSMLTRAEITCTPQKTNKQPKMGKKKKKKIFYISHSAYLYVCYSILKAKTYNWLPNTHTHAHTNTHMHTHTTTTTNKKQLGMSHHLLMVI